jgi:hypothetical protein
MRIVNAYRALAGVPSVRIEPSWSAPAQACALLSHANDQLSHSPPSDWSCWSDVAAQAASSSLLANRSAPIAIDAFITDRGNESSMVHRRWLLSENVHRLGVGSTNAYACVLVDGRAWDLPDVSRASSSMSIVESESASSAPAWVAWPPGGKVPFELFRTNRLDTLGWTIQSSSLEVDGATIEVREGDRPRDIDVYPLERTLGSFTALRFVPRGWSTQAGARYDVQLTLGDERIAYVVEPVTCP